MIERDLDIPFVANLALREKQIQQNYRPIIAVHKWFARRPGTLFRSILLSEFGTGPLREAYYRSNDLAGRRVADPFMGGGTPLLEANRLGCDVTGFDINPMAYWVVKQEMASLDLDKYRAHASDLRASLETEVGGYYRTKCMVCGSEDAHVKYFLWVKTANCPKCRKPADLFPGHLLAEKGRHPRNVLVCPACGTLNERDSLEDLGKCSGCKAHLSVKGTAAGNRFTCPHCEAQGRYPTNPEAPPPHRMFAIEYHCLRCRPKHAGRFFKVPDSADLAKYEQVTGAWERARSRFVPDDDIPQGDESTRLHRWGYRKYRELFNPRQLLGLELSARFIDKVKDDSIRDALATNLSDLLRYQNLLCRYDVMALKSLDVFSMHGFPVSLVQCESNLLGIPTDSASSNVGSGGWSNIVDKYTKAKDYCLRPFEIRHVNQRKVVVPIEGEWIGEGGVGTRRKKVSLNSGDATLARIPAGSLDAVLTDPPYFGNVQYAELMDFCYVWLRKLVGTGCPAFSAPSTRNSGELTGNENMGRGIEHFAEGLAAVFARMAKALKAGAPLVFTYHHNRIEAYYPVAMTILDSGLVCSGSLPCPGEMGASIHINGTGSSIIDTVFVCRSTGTVPKAWIVDSPEDVAQLVELDLARLREGAVSPTAGDARCVAYGHLIRLAIWNLRKGWDSKAATKSKLGRIGEWIKAFGGAEAVQASGGRMPVAAAAGLLVAREGRAQYGDRGHDISF